VTKKRN